MHDPGASARELARILRFLDGDDRRPGAEVRLEVLGREMRGVIAAQKVHDGRLKVLETHLEGNPLLLDKPTALALVDHLEDHDARHGWWMSVWRLAGKSSMQLVFAMLQALLLAAFAIDRFGGPK